MSTRVNSQSIPNLVYEPGPTSNPDDSRIAALLTQTLLKDSECYKLMKDEKKENFSKVQSCSEYATRLIEVFKERNLCIPSRRARGDYNSSYLHLEPDVQKIAEQSGLNLKDVCNSQGIPERLDLYADRFQGGSKSDRTFRDLNQGGFKAVQETYETLKQKGVVLNCGDARYKALKPGEDIHLSVIGEYPRAGSDPYFSYNGASLGKLRQKTTEEILKI